MCGIAGIISFKEDMRGEIASCSAMQKALLRRGPDQRGIFLSQEVAFVHTRLAVIDISGGRQPMTATIGECRYTIVYNGELYNTQELREILSAEFPLETKSDTEIVLYSYIKWGAECVNYFNGIFAFAIYDEKKHKVFLARDRIGVKPLFYCKLKDKLVFASELNALLEYPDIPHEIDENGVAELLLLAPGRTAIAVSTAKKVLIYGNIGGFMRMNCTKLLSRLLNIPVNSFLIQSAVNLFRTFPCVHFFRADLIQALYRLLPLLN